MIRLETPACKDCEATAERIFARVRVRMPIRQTADGSFMEDPFKPPRPNWDTVEVVEDDISNQVRVCCPNGHEWESFYQGDL